MAQVTSPIILDSTGQQIHSDLQQIKNVLTTPSTAADISFDNTGTGMQADDVQDAITELKSNLTELEPTSYSTQGLSSSNATIDGGGYFKIGKVVFVNILITATSNIGNWTDIIIGLPNPLIENITLITNNISNTDKQPTDFHLISRNNTGAIATMSSGSAVNSGYKYSITGHYLTN